MRTKIIFFIFLFLLLNSCKEENQPPIIQSITASLSTIKTNETTQLTCVATDPDSNQLTYSWSSSDGTFPNGTNGNSISWKAPMEFGNYNILVIVDDGKNITDAKVNISVEANPQMTITPANLDFGNEDNEKTFDIKNSGTGTLTWSVSESLDWLTVSPESGETTSEIDKTTVTINRSGVSPGKYSGHITILSNGGNQEINITMEVTANPSLSVIPASLDFGTTTTQQTIDIKNSGTGTLAWSVSESLDWLTVSPESGETTTETDKVTVTVNRDGLSPGNYSGGITVTSNGENQEINITMEVPANPSLSITPTSLDFGTTTTQQTLDINNSGTGTLKWSVSESLDWLTVSPESGETTTETDKITVTINRSGVSPGKYSGGITVTSNGGNQKINITIEVTAKPSLSVAPTNLDFGTTASQQTFEIRNSGTGTLTWSVPKSYNFLTVSPESGETTTETDKVTVTLNREGLSYGPRSVNIKVSSNAGIQEINVTLEIPANPLLSVTPASLDFGTTTTHQTLYIKNSGTGWLTWSISEDLDWLTVSQESGAIGQRSEQLTVTVNRDELSPGYYVGTIIISSDAGTEEIEVTLIKLGTFTDTRDGKIYKTIKIGNQTWLAENLAYLPVVSNHDEMSATEPHYYVYDFSYSGNVSPYDPVAKAKETGSFKNFGVLYNWEAAKISCPAGWHLPSDNEWKELEMFLGMSQEDADGTSERGREQEVGLQLRIGGNLSNGSGGSYFDTATNSSGFSAKRGGCLNGWGNFAVMPETGFWWSATKYSEREIWSRNMHYGNKGVIRYFYGISHGLSVRCVKD